jgi:hypothetical protein
MMEWLLTPISGATDHAIAPWAAWHGRLMVLSWSFLLPVGMLAARYFKVTPGQDWPHVLDNTGRTFSTTKCGGARTFGSRAPASRR